MIQTLDNAAAATAPGSRTSDGNVDAAGAGAPTSTAHSPNATAIDTHTGTSTDASTVLSDSANAFAQVSATVDTTASAAAIPVPLARTTAASVVPAPTFAPPSSGAGAVGGGVMALLLVVGLILALAWLAKRMPGVGNAAVSNPALRVVGSLTLGPRERVVVVAVGQTQLLLSVGAGGTRALHTLAEPLPCPDAAPSPFASLLAQHFGKKS